MAAHRAAPLHYDPVSGWLTGIRHCPSPNRDPRPPGTVVDLVVVHGISLPPGEFGTGWIDRLFTNALDGYAHPFFRTLQGLRVSAHLLIDRQGEVTQYVPLIARAWHAGASHFRGREACNDFSIGIELEGTDDLPYTEAQYRRLADVLALLDRHFPGLGPDRIVGHSEIAPGRKTDPGPAFDWRHLQLALRDRGVLTGDIT